MPAMQLHRAVDHALGGFGRKHLGHRRLAGDAAGALILGPSCAIDQERRGIHFRRAVGDRALRHLQVGQRRAEQVTRGRVFQRLVQGAAGEAQRGRPHG
jgi:hypothetical protein